MVPDKPTDVKADEGNRRGLNPIIYSQAAVLGVCNEKQLFDCCLS